MQSKTILQNPTPTKYIHIMFKTETCKNTFPSNIPATFMSLSQIFHEFHGRKIF